MVLTIGTVSGVYAMWNYFGLPADPHNQNFVIGIKDFYYPENLPDDEEGELYHGGLLEKIISVEEGLNGTNTLLTNAVNDRKEDKKDTVSSNQQVSGGNLKNKFSTVEGFENVGFLIHFYSDTVYHIYTFDNRDTSNTGLTITVYKTNAEKNEDGVWVLKGGYKGTAVVEKYDGKTNGPYKNSINPLTWIKDA
jgi:hypothetical protein